MNTKHHDGTARFIPGATPDMHHISPSELAALGLEQIAFVKPVMTEQGRAFSIHAADGTPIAIASNASLAAAAIIQNEMTPNLVH
ncbi:DUF1150 family protein [Acidocella sp.]|uniref:DUF1150 family protein n=1 Tax=Acidocella sp. TaxID=50710 RepID=UPI002615C5FD|nr:DUF1150 family protein [Acidocella sp.]